MNLASRRHVATTGNLDTEDATTSQPRAIKKRLLDQRKKQAITLVEIASTVESLRFVVSWPDEQLSKWLQKHAAMSAAEAATFLAFQAALGSRADDITSLRLSYPTIEALVRRKASTRPEILQRLGLGEQMNVESIDHLFDDAISELTREECWFPRGTEPVFPPRSEPPLSMVS